MMKLVAIGLGACLVGIILLVGKSVSKNVTKMIDYACDPNNPTHGPRRG